MTQPTQPESSPRDVADKPCGGWCLGDCPGCCACATRGCSGCTADLLDPEAQR